MYTNVFEETSHEREVRLKKEAEKAKKEANDREKERKINKFIKNQKKKPTGNQLATIWQPTGNPV